jgi:hypothetical protein
MAALTPDTWNVARGVVLALVAAITAAACGANQPTPPDRASGGIVAAPAPASTMETPGHRPSATPSQDELRAAAAIAYRGAEIPFTQSLKKIDHMYDKAKDFDSWRAHCAALDGALRTWITALQAISWPTDAAAHAKYLMRVEAATDADYHSCATARTKEAYEQALQASGRFEDKVDEAERLVRLDLGLNPLPA